MSDFAQGQIDTERRSFAPRDEAMTAPSLGELAVRSLRTAREELAVWAGAKTRTVGDAVESRPVTALTAALGVGVIIGLLRRR